MKTKIIVMSVVTVLLVAVTFKLKSNKHTVDANVFKPDPDKKVLVQAQAVESINLQRIYNYTGTFAAYREVMLVPQVGGEAHGIYFEEGDLVREGKLLLQVDDDLLQAQYAAADASYRNAKRNLERYESASLSGGVSKLQLDNFRLTYETAEAQRKQLAKQIQLCKISAPFSGTITLRDVEPGSVVGSSPIARLTDLTQLKLEISVPEKEIVFFTEGENATVKTDVYPDKTLPGKIDHVADRGDDTHNYVVRIHVTNVDHQVVLKAGMYGTAVITQDPGQESLVIPRAALLGSAKSPQVFVVENDKARLKNIKTGRTTNDYVEILQGLEKDEKVVTGGHINLGNGSNVQIVKNNI
jgi:RND family efflux transporter MFP subunit